MSGRPPFRDDIVYDDEGPQRRRFPIRSADHDSDDDAERPQHGALPARATRELESRRAAGEILEAIIPKHARNLATTFWGMAWNRYLAECADYASRLPRGRTALRAGRVLRLTLETGCIRAVVAGQRLFDVTITIRPPDDDAAAALAQRLRGRIGTIVELLSGDLSAEVMTIVAAPETGLFPSPSDICFACSCPDDASLCEHAAAALYASGCRFDDHPAELFRLRGIDPASLQTSNLGDVVSALTGEITPPAVDGADLSALFGINLGDHQDS